MTAELRWATLLAVTLGGCALEQSPLAGGATGEDAVLMAIVEADRAADCARVIELAPSFSTTRADRLERVDFIVGRCLYRAGRFAVATEVLDRVRARPPRSYTGEALYLAARSQYRQKLFEDAIARFAAALECCAGRRADNARYYTARARYRLDDLLGARADFEALLADPDASPSYRARALYYIGKTHYRRASSGAEPDGIAAADAWFARVGAEHPEAAVADDALYGRGKVAWRTDRPAEALAHFEAVITGWPLGGAAVRAGYYRARALAALGRFDEALAAFAQFEADHPSHAFADNARYRHGRALYARASAEPADAARWYAAAEQVFAALLIGMPETTYATRARYWRARSLYKLDQREAARPLFEAVADAPSGYADNARYYAGMCHYHRGVDLGDPARWQAALDVFAELDRAFPDSRYRAGAAYFTGRALTRLGRLDRADAAFAKLVIDWPESSYVDDAWRRRIELALDRLDCAAAADHLDVMRSTTPDSPHLDGLVTALEGTAC